MLDYTIEIQGKSFKKTELQKLAKDLRLKYKARGKYFCNSEETFKFCLKTFIATSYRWWTIYEQKEGLWFFNNTNYSTTTGRHQNQMIDLINNLGLKVDRFFYNCTQDLGRLSLEELTDLEKNKIEAIISELGKPRKWKSTRADLVLYLQGKQLALTSNCEWVLEQNKTPLEFYKEFCAKVNVTPKISDELYNKVIEDNLKFEKHHKFYDEIQKTVKAKKLKENVKEWLN